VCGLDYAFADSGDGPAFFVMSCGGFIVLSLAMGVISAYEPRLWVHMVLWAPLTIVLSLALVRPFKGVLIALQFQHRAEEGRLKR